MKFCNLLCFVALAAATPVPTAIEDYTRMLKRQSSGVSLTAGDLSNFQFYSEYAAAAYCNSQTAAGQPITCSGQCPDVTATVVTSFVGALTGIGGYVAVNNNRKEIVLSIRGSSNIRNWITDILFGFLPSNLCSGCQVHTGFSTAWTEISSVATAAVKQAVAANPGYKIIATGHSLGAAVATLGGAFLRNGGLSVDIYTYGSPRIGNSNFANYVTAQPGGQYRVTHLDDPVPRLPPIIFDYRHVSPEYWLSDGTATTVTYSLSDIKVCTGIANVNCNAGTGGFDVNAHLYYFRAISGCDSPGLSFKRDLGNSTFLGNTTTDQELIDRLNLWSQQDQEFVATLAKRDDTPDQELVERLNLWSQQDQAFANSL